MLLPVPLPPVDGVVGVPVEGVDGVPVVGDDGVPVVGELGVPVCGDAVAPPEPQPTNATLAANNTQKLIPRRGP